MKDLEGFIDPASEQGRILAAIDLGRLPRHIAIIMDGNGRWAGRRRLPRIAGHQAGIEAVRDTVEASARLGLEVLTLYAFSRENWKRPRSEVSMLFELLKQYIRSELETLQKNNIRFNVIGRVEELSRPVRRELQRAMDATRANTGLLFNTALSYSGRTEILDACREAMARAADGRLSPEALDEETLARFLYTGGQPDPDLLIRTSGEMRISNFLLWQIAYAEIWVTETLWPDFRRGELLRAILDFQKRERRYGGIGEGERGRESGSRRLVVRG